MVRDMNHLLQILLGFESRSTAVDWPKCIETLPNALIHNLLLVERGGGCSLLSLRPGIPYMQRLFQQLTLFITDLDS
jgi:hypothetical protein